MKRRRKKGKTAAAAAKNKKQHHDNDDDERGTKPTHERPNADETRPDGNGQNPENHHNTNGTSPENGHQEPSLEELKLRASRLERELAEVTRTLKKRLLDDSAGGAEPGGTPPLEKSGYLFKWQDRSIGWGGTKWALRFIKMDRGRISYYYSHLETSPRYVLSLRGCAVRDEGWKRNRRHVSRKTPRGEDPPIDEAGAYFFVFSVYHFDSSSTKEEQLDLGPLLRFSTPSLAEKTQWIQLVSEACAYCETESFLREEAARNEEENLRRQQQRNMVQAMPQAERGTLPPLYFAQSEKKPRGLVRKPSLSRMPNSNMFRTKSASRDADKSEKKGFPPSRPMHRASEPSFLSEEAKTQNYRGFFNLAMIILVVSNFRLVFNSARKYGFVLSAIPSLSDYSFANWDQFPFVTGVLALQFFLVSAFAIEWCLAYKDLYEPLGMVLHQLNAHACLAVSTFIVWNFIAAPTVGACLMFNSAIVWMKLVSYAHANQDYRLSSKKKAPGDAYHQANLAIIENLDQRDFGIEYPSNITLWNIYYFWLAPTLTYQIAFPKTPRVRWLRVLLLLLRMAFVFFLFTFLIAQTVSPNLESFLKDLDASEGKYSLNMIAEYWLKLSIPNTYLWLMVFYFYFHLYLNLFAELLRFGDRVFYKDWWNSGEVSAYWRLWNLPVHYWLVRHLYFPCVRFGFSKTAATFAVFTFSAVMHELLVSIPFHMLRPWSFLGMMSQIPLVVVTKFLYRKYPNSSVGNIMFWTCFCLVGQPMAILLYTIDYKYSSEFDGDTPQIFQEQKFCRIRFGEKCLFH